MQAITENIEIHSLTHEGRGLAQIDGKTTFVAGALPTETVNIKYLRKRGKFDEAEAIDIVKPATDRQTPACSAFGRCGGCSLQHLQHSAQIKFKQQSVLDLLQRIGHVSAENILPPLTGPQFAYRRKARLGVRLVKNKGLLIGFREKNYPRFITDVTECPVLHPAIADHLTTLRSLITNLSIPSEIPQLEIAIGDDAAAIVMRHLQPLEDADIELLIEFAANTGIHFYLQPGKLKSIHRIWPAPTESPQRLRLDQPDHNLSLWFHPVDFTQVNFDINQKMVKQAIELLDPQADENILDLFCGLGNFSLAIAKHAKHVIAVEGDAAMVERGTDNTIYNKINNCEFHCADLTESIIDKEWFADYKFNKVLIDPPRSGADKVIPQIVACEPQRIVYVSCDPATLARDAGILVNAHGYRLTHVGIMDMFPHTTHIETMAVFEK